MLLAAAFPLALRSPWWSLAVLVTAGATDVLDGWYARRFHEASATGAVLDALADKVFVLSAVTTLFVTGRLSFLEVVMLGTRDLGEIALAIRLRLTGHSVFGRAANAGGKLATLFQYAALVGTLVASNYQSARAENEGSAKGALHRGLTSARLALEGRTNEVILDECERGELGALATYDRALETVSLDAMPTSVRALLVSQRAAVKAAYDDISREEVRRRLSRH